MNIDITNIDNYIDINSDIDISNDRFDNTSIRNLVDVKFIGKLFRLSDNSYHLEGNLKGVMILPDDITLEDVNYPFDINIDEDIDEEGNSDKSIKLLQNKLDITEFLWQNILVEVPLKVKNPENDNLTLEGNGWRLITEDEINKSNDSPFGELSKIFDSRKE